ncbi:MAG: hypothetical protein H7Y33_10525 [Cytophagales bacterium]|nr:hypothetical protein [Rhizobacter sp.]
MRSLIRFSSPWAVALLFGLPVQGMAQPLYRCGNTYSQTPCAPDAAPARISAGAAPDQASGASGKDLCATEGVAQMRFPDPESTRVVAVAKGGAEVIQYAGKPLASRKFNITLNTKNEVGAYMGERVYVCYLSEDERRVLKVDSPRR